jgi:hypothetical protein
VVSIALNLLLLLMLLHLVLLLLLGLLLLNLLLGRSILLDMRVRVGQMAGASRVTTADGALLEVALENVTARKRIMA